MTSFRGHKKSPSARIPSFIQDLEDAVVRSGGTASLECRVAGFPKPEIRWERRGKMVAKSRYVHTERTGDRCLLQIKSCREKDGDLYICVATNIMGSAHSTAKINILGENERSPQRAKNPPVLKVEANYNAKNTSLKKDKETPSTKQRDSSPNVRNLPFRCFRSSPARLKDSPTKRQDFPPVNGRKVETPSHRKDLLSVVGKMVPHVAAPPKPDRTETRPRVLSVGRPEKSSAQKTTGQGNPKKPLSANNCCEEKGKDVSLLNQEKSSGKPTLRGRRVDRVGFVAKSNLLNSSSIKVKENRFARKEEKTMLSQVTSVQKVPTTKSKSKEDMHPSERRKSIKLTRQNRIEDDDCYEGPFGTQTDQGQLSSAKENVFEGLDRQENNETRNYKSDSGRLEVLTSVPLTVAGDEPSVTAMVSSSAEDTITSVPHFESDQKDITENQEDQMFECHSMEVENGQPSSPREKKNGPGYVDDGGIFPEEIVAERPSSVHPLNTEASLEHRMVPSPTNGSLESAADVCNSGGGLATEQSVSDAGSEAEGSPEVPQITNFLPSPKAKKEVESGKFPDEADLKGDAESLCPRKVWSRRERDPFEFQSCTGSLRFDNAVIEEECEFLVKSGVLLEVDEEKPDDMHHVEPCLEHPVRIVKGPQSVTVLRGESVTLAAHFTGAPQPSVTWAKGGKTLSSDGRVSILVGRDMSVLTICDVTADDSGKYVVSVENRRGGDSCFASMAVVGIPEPPGGQPNASDVTDHSLVLSWYGSMYDGGSVVTGYVVEMCTLPGRHWHRVSNCINTSHVIQGLSQGQHYVFRIRAENRYGLSNPSRESEAVFLEDTSASLEEWDNIPQPVEVEAGSRFSEQFELKEEVGKGRFGTVYRCIERTSGRPRAAKIIRCLKAKDKIKVQQEIDVMNRLHHPKLMQILAAFESGRNMIMVMEFISGGELFERVIADDFVLTEHDCILFMQQICDGVAYMHKSSILHLDLKPENILCKTRTSHQIKIIDFGLARVYNPEENLRVLFGTPEFVAPEVINYEPVLPASDMWSVGVVCYVLLSGLSPFMGDSDPETFANITRGEVDFDDDAFETISEEAKNFISKLLVKRSKARMSAEDCLKHLWLIDVKWDAQDVPLSTEKLKKFIVRRKWQKTGTAIRALGRMVSLSRSSMGSSSCSSSSPLASPPTTGIKSEISRSETSESGFSEISRDGSISELLS